MYRIAAFAIVCGVLGFPLGAGAQQLPGQTTTIDNNEPMTAAENPLATREQRLAVEPLDWNETRGEGLRPDIREPELPPPQSEQGSGTSERGQPDPDADANAREAYPDEWEGLRQQQSAAPDDDQSPLGTADVFTQYCENCSAVNLAFPQRAAGKLFTNKGSCSASVVSPNNVIVTAAHCCYDRSAGDFIRGWQFAPAYRDGFTPYGLFNWSQATVLNRWIDVGDRQSDVCVIRLANDASGRPVTHYTGWLGRSWNWPTVQVHHSLGYPGNIGGGNKLELCVSESFNPSSGCGGASVLNTGCSMTYGASGGPWIRGYRGSGDWVNSVVSGYDGTSCTGSFGSTYNGPRFTSDNIVTLCNTIGC
ncbi:MAG TPA: hypothetical protein VK943_13210 [Arenibaculum sp.]|nr:hypothetical protein [Arenibaculum sp.]